MGFRFRKSKKIGPVRVTMSKTGLSYSVGVKGLRVTKTASGRVRTTASLPGTGISCVKESGGKGRSLSRAAARPAPPMADDPPSFSAPPVVSSHGSHVLKLILIGAVIGIILAIVLHLIYSGLSGPVSLPAPTPTVFVTRQAAAPAPQESVSPVSALVLVTPTAPEPTPTPVSLHTYVVNTNTGKFHYPGCKSVSEMKDSNKMVVESTRDDLLDQGYSPCGRCKP